MVCATSLLPPSSSGLGHMLRRPAWPGGDPEPQTPEHFLILPAMQVDMWTRFCARKGLLFPVPRHQERQLAAACRGGANKARYTHAGSLLAWTPCQTPCREPVPSPPNACGTWQRSKLTFHNAQLARVITSFFFIVRLSVRIVFVQPCLETHRLQHQATGPTATRAEWEAP